MNMGKRIAAMFDFVEDKKGRDGKVALARETGVSSVIAEGTPETPELMERFRAAVKKITGENPPA
jgi:hypothetical protein